MDTPSAKALRPWIPVSGMMEFSGKVKQGALMKYWMTFFRAVNMSGVQNPPLEEENLAKRMTDVCENLIGPEEMNIIAVFPMGGGKSSIIPIGLRGLFGSYHHLQPRVVAVEEAYERSWTVMKVVSQYLSTHAYQVRDSLGPDFCEVALGSFKNPELCRLMIGGQTSEVRSLAREGSLQHKTEFFGLTDSSHVGADEIHNFETSAFDVLGESINRCR